MVACEQGSGVGRARSLRVGDVSGIAAGQDRPRERQRVERGSRLRAACGYWCPRWASSKRGGRATASASA